MEIPVKIRKELDTLYECINSNTSELITYERTLGE